MFSLTHPFISFSEKKLGKNPEMSSSSARARDAAPVLALAAGGAFLLAWGAYRAWNKWPGPPAAPVSPSKGEATHAAAPGAAKARAGGAGGDTALIRRQTSAGAAPLTARIRAVRAPAEAGGEASPHAGSGDSSDSAAAARAASRAGATTADGGSAPSPPALADLVLPPPASLPRIRTDRPVGADAGGGADSLPTTPRAGAAAAAVEAGPFAWAWPADEAGAPTVNKTSPSFVEVAAAAGGLAGVE